MCAPGGDGDEPVPLAQAGLIEAGEIGQPTLAVAQMANMGPSAWRDYTGDPAVFYGPASAR